VKPGVGWHDDDSSGGVVEGDGGEVEIEVSYSIQ
jgi:hypothetical protein